MRFGGYVRTLDAAALKRDYGEILQRHSASPSTDTAIRLSLLLSESDSPPHTVGEVLGLLRHAYEGRKGDEADFARLLHDLIGKRASCEDDPDSSLAELLARERDRNRSLDRELAATRASLEAEQRARGALTKQLEALKSVEEQIKKLDE